VDGVTKKALLKLEAIMEMNAMQDKISKWAESTFDHNERGIALHLLREAIELCLQVDGIEDDEIRDAVDITFRKWRQTSISEETADVTILALAMAGYLGFDLEMAVGAKHAVNIVRTWGEPDGQGITEHMRV
jgi:NTP pyrophosphatase (non-canonical NTP hydrolase)